MNRNAMVKVAESGGGAPAAGLARLVADAFMLRAQAEMTLWTLDGRSAELSGLLARFQSSPGEVIQTLVTRIQILGGRPPRSFAELHLLSSVLEPGDGSSAACVARLASECAVLKDGCRMVAMLARTCGDDTTEDIVSRPTALLEETAWRLKGLGDYIAQASQAPLGGDR